MASYINKVLQHPNPKAFHAAAPRLPTARRRNITAPAPDPLSTAPPLLVAPRAASGAGADAAAPREWGALTERLVAASSLPFTVLVLPQVIQNQANIAGGALGALAAISWLGYAAGLAGNALMCTHLAARGEATAVNVQLIGIASTLLILGQLWWARVMPTRAFGGALVMAAAVAAAGSLKARGRLGRREWLAFEAVVSVFGVLAVPQVGGACGLVRDRCCPNLFGCLGAA
jgi:hypothetical protein